MLSSSHNCRYFPQALEISSRKASRGNGLTYVLYDLKIFFSKGKERLELQDRSSEKKYETVLQNL